MSNKFYQYILESLIAEYRTVFYKDLYFLFLKDYEHMTRSQFWKIVDRSIKNESCKIVQSHGEERIVVASEKIIIKYGRSGKVDMSCLFHDAFVSSFKARCAPVLDSKIVNSDSSARTNLIVPDSVVQKAGINIAVEVELSAKSEERILNKIIQYNDSGYESVVYIFNNKKLCKKYEIFYSSIKQLSVLKRIKMHTCYIEDHPVRSNWSEVIDTFLRLQNELIYANERN